MSEGTRKQQIVETAAVLFKERGYNAVTMRDLADAMGIKAASLYNHISGKQEILKELTLHVAHDFINGINFISKSTLSPKQKLEEVIKLHFELSVEHTNKLAAVYNEWMHLEGDSYQEYVNLRNEYDVAFKSLLSDAIGAGSIKDISLDVLSFNLLSTLRSIYLWTSRRSKKEIRELKANIADLLLHGVVNE